MNRRDALAKLAAGGVGAASASAIVSRAAFAGGAAPSNLPTPDINIGALLNTNNNSGTLTMAFRSLQTCGASATIKRIVWDYTITNVSQMNSPTPVANSIDVTTTTVPSTQTLPMNRITGTTNRLTVTVRARFECVYPTRTVTVCQSYVRTFENLQGGQNVWTQTAITTGTACPVAP